MKKDAYYFSHDYNAATDIKIIRMRQKYGMEGYGAYWFIVELLANSGGILPLDFTQFISQQTGCSQELIRAIIEDFNLFSISDSHFYSERLKKHLNARKSLSKLGKAGAGSRWKKVQDFSDSPANGVANGVAIREANGVAIGEANGDPNAKERKGKERKVNNINIDIKGKKFEFNEVAELPSNYITSIQEQLYTLRGNKLEAEKILELWESFRLEKITGDIFYNSKKDIYLHFVNWIKLQKFTTKTTAKNEQRSDQRKSYASRHD